MADARVCMTTLQHALARAARVFRVRGSINKKQGDNVIKNTNTNTFKMSDCRIGLGCGWLGLGFRGDPRVLGVRVSGICSSNFESKQ